MKYLVDVLDRRDVLGDVLDDVERGDDVELVRKDSLLGVVLDELDIGLAPLGVVQALDVDLRAGDAEVPE